MKNKRNILIGIISLIIIVGAILAIIFYRKSNYLTIEEKSWIDEATSTSKVINIGIVNDAYVFGYEGNGIFYDFVDEFKDLYKLNINEYPYSNKTTTSLAITLGTKTSVSDNDLVFYKDHYVLVSSNYKIINGYDDLKGKNIAILKNDLSYVSDYIPVDGMKFSTYDDANVLLASLSQNDYAILPLYLYLGEIIKSNVEVIYHFSDINYYYTLTITDDTLSSILTKYYNEWVTSFEDRFNEKLFNVLTTSLGYQEADIDKMYSVEYNYGFINNSPYEVITGGNYGGIVAMYLQGFSNLTGVDINFKKYRNLSRFESALNSGKIDLYFGYYNINSNYSYTSSGVLANYYVIQNKKNSSVVSSIKSLEGKEVYVEKSSFIYSYIANNNKISIKTYSKASELKKLNNKDVIIVIDKNIFDYYKDSFLDNYSIRYEDSLDTVYSFRVNNNTPLYTLLNKYISITDYKEMTNKGFYLHGKLMAKANLITTIIIICLHVVGIIIIGLVISIKKKKKIVIQKHIKSNDKIRFIDQLTMLKNRNYLKENIDKWQNNKIYPQAVIVLDLNGISKINDQNGYEEGDKQIKSAANALIKTQLDNSDVIRTDGNEFVIYMVGYNQKQITNYIHKINKEFKKLPYDFGAEFGYSLILDDIKTIEDALNEATNDLKKQKINHENKD